MANRPTDYRAIRYWGEYLHSFAYYIADQQRLAAADNAPTDAIYKDGSTWRTVRDITNPNAKDYMARRFDDERQAVAAYIAEGLGEV